MAETTEQRKGSRRHVARVWVLLLASLALDVSAADACSNLMTRPAFAGDGTLSWCRLSTRLAAAHCFELGGRPHLLTLARDTGQLVVRSIGADAVIADLIDQGRLDAKATAVTTVAGEGVPHLALVAAAPPALRIHSIRPDGRPGELLDERALERTWPELHAFGRGSERFVVCFDPAGGAYETFRVTGDGVLGERVDRRARRPGVHRIAFYEVGAATVRLRLDDRRGTWQVQSLAATGLGHGPERSGAVGSGWTTVLPFRALGGNFLLLHDAATGLARFHELGTDGGIEQVVDEDQWPTQYSHFTSFAAADSTYLVMLRGETGIGKIKSLAPPRPLRSCGPLVGHVTATNAMIWAWSAGAEPCAVRYRAAGASAPVWRSLPLLPNGEGDCPAGVALLTNLTPATAYEYRVEGLDPVPAGSFFTAPPVAEPARFTVAVASGAHIEQHPRQPSWTAVRQTRPALQLLVGNTTYCDSTDPSVARRWHFAQRQETNFAAVIREVPTYAIWDAHDFAGAGSHGGSEGRQDALGTFRELFANPPNLGPRASHLFCTFHWADVQFFLLDGRSYRKPWSAPDNDSKRLLGDGQFAWLAGQLTRSTARFKVLAIGTPLTAPGADTWQAYGYARRRLFNLLRRHRVEGVIFVSGAAGGCYLRLHSARETGGYALPEITSSGIAHGEAREFVTLAFDTAAADPTVAASIHRPDGQVRRRIVIRRSQLQLER